MYRRLVVVAAIGWLTATAWASEPGQPLDCSDWVFLEPGLSCRTVIPWPCAPLGALDQVDPLCNRGNRRATDTLGRLLQVRFVKGTHPCGGGKDRLELVAYGSAGQVMVLGFVETRGPFGDRSYDMPAAALPTESGLAYAESAITFDSKSGIAYISAASYCYACVANGSCSGAYGNGDIRPYYFAVDGFPTDFEILQTYSPGLNSLGFRTPYMPEGFAAADFFDTYYGDLATLGDWSQAQPLQCAYPAAPPTVGDYLLVDDHLPNPTPGTGRYYVTAVTRQGERRFGRRQCAGVTSGRNPATLPMCTP